MITGPTLCSVGENGIIVAPISPELGLPAEVASIMAPLVDGVGLRVAVVAGTMEASIAPAKPIAEVVELPAFSVAVIA